MCNHRACYGYGQNVHLGADTKYGSNDSIFRGITLRVVWNTDDLVEPDILKLHVFWTGLIYHTFSHLNICGHILGSGRLRQEHALQVFPKVRLIKVQSQLIAGLYATVTQTASSSFLLDERQGKSVSVSGVVVMAHVRGSSDSVTQSLRLASRQGRLNGAHAMVCHELVGVHPT